MLIPSIKLVPLIKIKKQKHVKNIENGLLLIKKSIKKTLVDKILISKKIKKDKINKNWKKNFFNGLVIISKSETNPKEKINKKKYDNK